jgi:hypothetical protein
LERHRLVAANLLALGLSAAVAHRLGVSRQSAPLVSRVAAGGVQALRARGPIGRHRRLLRTQLDQAEHALLKRADAHEFASNPLGCCAAADEIVD